MVLYCDVRTVASLGLLGATSCAGPAGFDFSQSQQALIYGSDDRVEARDLDDAAMGLVIRRRVGALIPKYAFSFEAGIYTVDGPTLAQTGVCADQRFTDQLAVATCTALRVSEDRIVTAGHCFSRDRASDAVFVTGYWLSEDFPRLRPSDVHELDELLVHVDGALAEAPDADVAVATLRERVPDDGIELEFASELPRTDDSVVVAGTSEGLPLKVDSGAKITALRGVGAFELTSDTFIGGSGSTVFAPDGKFLGIVVGGGQDYEFDEVGACLRRHTQEETTDFAEVAVAASVLEEALTRSRSAVGASCSLKYPLERPSRQFGSCWLLLALMGMRLRRSRMV